MKIETPSFPSLPAPISRLGELAYNLWWSWQPKARNLMRIIDPTQWRLTYHNPVAVLQRVDPSRLEKLARDAGFVTRYDQVVALFDRYLEGGDSWFRQTYPDDRETSIAYFCAEFGIDNALPIYSGGLGMLAGDTCKEASDLGLPFIAVGCFYPEGYFHQRIGPEGDQQVDYTRLNRQEAPILAVLNDDGSPLRVPITVGTDRVEIAVWKVQAGRVPLYLMDTDIEENAASFRDLSARLYGGDRQVRLRQEIVLGVGGVRVLEALGHRPSIIHLNEGHAAFASLELFRRIAQGGADTAAALSEIQGRVRFTTHTPVKAGHDEFSMSMMESGFQAFWEGIEDRRDACLGLGLAPDSDAFGMTVLALRTASRTNAVSRRHSQVSQQMWQRLWPDRSEQDIPIDSITNGIHVPTWVASEMADLFAEFLGEDWLRRHDDPEFWRGLYDIPDQRLWETHVSLKNRMLRFIRDRIRRRWAGNGLSTGQVVGLGSLLGPEALTFGFARRFATYKRGSLLFRDMERLRSILLNRYRPVQIVFAGKAHPADEPGKAVLKQVFQQAMSPELGGRVAFIEDYDKHVAHHLIQGVDVWLNTPVPPLEASGTSGQKASLNGVPNCSVLDGWWPEGYDGNNGWAVSEDVGRDDAATAEAIYSLIERDIAPLFYERDDRGIPSGWVALMRRTIQSLAAPFSARRMMKEYVRRLYFAEPRS